MINWLAGTRSVEGRVIMTLGDVLERLDVEGLKYSFSDSGDICSLSIGEFQPIQYTWNSKSVPEYEAVGIINILTNQITGTIL